jgi:hypothetical protein
MEEERPKLSLNLSNGHLAAAVKRSAMLFAGPTVDNGDLEELKGALAHFLWQLDRYAEHTGDLPRAEFDAVVKETTEIVSSFCGPNGKQEALGEFFEVVWSNVEQAWSES